MKVIGRQERIDLPELGYRAIKAKVDTGAYGNALHCTEIEVIIRDGKELLAFTLLDERHPEYKEERQYVDEFTDKLVKNSSGEKEHRYTIDTVVVFYGKKTRACFSLTDRSTMKYPILLGRKFLKGKYLVDVRLKDVSHKKKGKK